MAIASHAGHGDKAHFSSRHLQLQSNTFEIPPHRNPRKFCILCPVRITAFAIIPAKPACFLSGGTDLRKGDALVTSGLDGVFPAGIPVGTVSSTAPDAHSGASSRVMVWPAANLDESRMVLVLLVDRSALPAPPPADPAPDARKRRAGS